MQKTAAQLSNEILKKLSFQGRMGFEASSVGGAAKPAMPAAPMPAAPKPPMPAAAPMPKTSSQIADEVLFKLSKFPFRPAAQKYVTQAEMSMAREKNLSQLKPASKTAPSSMPTERKNLSEIPVWPHKKTASQLSTEILKKLAEGEQLDEQYYEDTPARKRHWPMGAAGLLAGGAAAHYLAPSQMTKDYRETAKSLGEPAKASLEAHKPSYDPKLDKFTGVLPEEHMTHIKDVSAAGRPVRFNAPAHAAQKYFKSRAWQEAMPRTLLGAGLGLGGGLLASSLF